MALRVWLPLNGNLENKGLSPAKAEAVTTVSFSDGKIGQSLSGGKIKIPAAYVGDIFNNEHMSICFWYYTNTDATTGNHSICGFSGNGEGDSGASRSWDFFAYSIPTTFHWSMGTIGGGSLANVLPNNQWVHIAVTFDGSKLLIYFNGVLQYTGSGSSNFTFDKSYYISFGSTLQKLNDFRIYDECLSPKQIKEISKYLMAHYKLDTPGVINNLTRNSTYNTYNNFYSSGTTGTLTKLTEQYQECNIYRLTMTPNATSLSSFQTALWAHGIYGFSNTFKANTKYCFWILWRPVTHNDVVVGGTASNIGGWTEIPSAEWGDGWNIVGQYRDGSVTTDKTDSIFISFKTPTAAEGVPISIDFCCPHLVEGYDYILNEYNYKGTDLETVTDNSGNGYNATKSGTLIFNTNSPRYNGSMKFSSDSYLKINKLLNSDVKEASFSFWFNMDGASGQYPGIFVPNSNPTAQNGLWLSVNTESAGLWAYRASFSPNYHKAGTLIETSGWHHAVFVWNNGVSKWYLDGSQYGSTVDTWATDTLSSTLDYTIGDSYTGTNWNGTLFTGRLSDFRIYATALSENDIKELYQTSAAVDNKKNIYAYEFKEE